ncbi:hypothetical protein WU85_08800 [Corynebacterium striatum]|nr:hypothetical protein WU85_08800 [Corynebacterium striatum]
MAKPAIWFLSRALVSLPAKFEQAMCLTRFHRRPSVIRKRIEGSQLNGAAHAGDTLRLIAAFSYAARLCSCTGHFLLKMSRRKFTEMFRKEAK